MATTLLFNATTMNDHISPNQTQGAPVFNLQCRWADKRYIQKPRRKTSILSNERTLPQRWRHPSLLQKQDNSHRVKKLGATAQVLTHKNHVLQNESAEKDRVLPEQMQKVAQEALRRHHQN